jgi:hypothetical protein
MSVPFGMSHPPDRESSNRACPVRESVALDRSKHPPRERVWQATFLGGTEPRAARPLGASLRVRQLGAIRKACQRNPSSRLVPMPIGPAAGVVMLNEPPLAKRGEIEDGTKKGLPNLRGEDGYTLENVEPRLSRPDAAPTPADEGRGDPAHRGRRGQLYCRITGRSATEPLGPHCSTPPDMADPSEISRQVELALFYDRQLNLKTPTST